MPDTFTPEQIAQILEEFFRVVGTRQYIGARYVPIFGRRDEETIEWDNTGEYEPLTIVLYQGNSYTSRQFVPVGVEITNQDFWAITGNYNAQIEMYRRETAAVREIAEAAQGDINTLLPKSYFVDEETTVKDYVDTGLSTLSDYVDDGFTAVGNVIGPNFDQTDHTVSNFEDEVNATLAGFVDQAVKPYVDGEIDELDRTLRDQIVTDINAYNPSYVGSYGAVENDPTVDWATVLDSIADVSDTVYFGCGKWDLGEGIEIPTTINTVYGSGATLYTSSDNNPDHLVNVDAVTRFSGLNFVGDGKVNKLLASLTEDAGNRLQVDDCNFRNIGRGNYAIYNEYIGVMCNACFFNNTSTHAGGTAIKTHTDNIVNGCKFFRFDFDIAAFGVNCNNCYFWHTTDTQGCVFVPEHWDNRQAFDEQVGLHYDIIATNCEFDCVKKLVVNPVNCVIHNNHFYWNDRDLTENDTVYLFFLTGTYVNMHSIDFSYNIFKFQTISYDVYEFGHYQGTIGNDHTGQVNRYHSMCNLYTDNVYSLTTIDKYHLMCGWVSTNYMRSGSQNYWCHCYATNTTRNNSNQTLTMRSNENFWEYDIVNGAHQMTIKNSVARQSILSSNSGYYKSDAVDMWFTALPFSFQEIEIRAGALMMFDMVSTVSVDNPDVSGYTQVTPLKIQYSS